ncbi:hypothetical protein DQ238_12825 [Geodermatophilus sp. TF02-6]|uniref:hypothetical protein n=1 Tax=Geodermatophilus sp. TF02-6 TaxID=2250575 RepID=UPI000DE825A5|nr:hypothetical protein [Geodermatophilus sp. TF02-6]RBY78346.1 hypothetical protein DQ238_12825 [Geodermatophilus sp. TF02-6]
MRDALLLPHVAAGTAGLLLGPLWLAARLRGLPDRGLAGAYQLAVAVVAVSGAVLALVAPGLAWLLPVAGLTGGLAVAGALARRRAWPHWPTLQPHLLGGSYTALVTGALVASTGNPVWWVLPALAAQPPIAVAKRRLRAGSVEASPAHLRRSTTPR